MARPSYGLASSHCALEKVEMDKPKFRSRNFQIKQFRPKMCKIFKIIQHKLTTDSTRKLTSSKGFCLFTSEKEFLPTNCLTIRTNKLNENEEKKSNETTNSLCICTLNALKSSRCRHANGCVLASCEVARTMVIAEIFKDFKYFIDQVIEQLID